MRIIIHCPWCHHVIDLDDDGEYITFSKSAVREPGREGRSIRECPKCNKMLSVGVYVTIERSQPLTMGQLQELPDEELMRW